eukprot:6543757-Pyramimonas_sp.AAC.1
MTWVRAWALQLDGAYLVLRAQKSTTDVAAGLLVHDDAEAGGRGSDSSRHAPLRAIVDIGMCFDEVPW